SWGPAMVTSSSVVRCPITGTPTLVQPAPFQWIANAALWPIPTAHAFDVFHAARLLRWVSPAEALGLAITWNVASHTGPAEAVGDPATSVDASTPAVTRARASLRTVTSPHA